MPRKDSIRQGKRFEQILCNFLKAVIPQLEYEFINGPEVVPGGLQYGFDVRADWKDAKSGNIYRWRFECKNYQSVKNTSRRKTIPKNISNDKFRDIENYLHNNDCDVYCICSPTKPFSNTVVNDTIPNFNKEQRIHAVQWTGSENRFRYLFELCEREEEFQEIYGEKLLTLTKEARRKRRGDLRAFFERNTREAWNKRSIDTKELFISKFRATLEKRKFYFDEYIQTTLFDKWMERLSLFLEDDSYSILFVHGPSGIGKTRFIIEALKKVESKKNFYFIGKTNLMDGKIDIEKLKRDIWGDKGNILIIDDAHTIQNFQNIEKLIGNKLQKVIAITWTYFVQTLKNKIDEPVSSLELTKIMEKEKIEEFFRKTIGVRIETEVKHLASLTEGHPLLLVIFGFLIQQRQVKNREKLLLLTRNEAMAYYWSRIEEEIKTKEIDIQRIRYQPYLSCLFLLRPFSLKNNRIREIFRGIVGIDEVEEGSILRQMEEMGILERGGDMEWIYPDLLGEFLVEDTFFSSTSLLNIDDLTRKLKTKELKVVFETLSSL